MLNFLKRLIQNTTQHTRVAYSPAFRDLDFKRASDRDSGSRP